MPESAESGLWTLNAFAEDTEGNPGGVFKKTYTVVKLKKEKPGEQSPLFILSIIIVLIVLIIIGKYAISRKKEKLQQPLLGREEEIVEKGIQYIRDNYAKLESVEEVAKHAGLSPGYFRNLFKKVKKQRLNEYILVFRIEQAGKLLVTTNKTISEIMFDVGLNHLPYFTKAFKKITGITPSQYREKNRK